jgi:hypothetical protein
MKWKEDMAQNTSVRVAVRVGMWSTMLSNGKDYYPIEVKKKVNRTLLQAVRLGTGCTAHRGSRGIALLFHDHGTRRGEGSASHPSCSLPPGKARYPLYRRLGGHQSRSGHYYPILYMYFVMGERMGMKSVTRFGKVMNKRTNL